MMIGPSEYRGDAMRQLKRRYKAVWTCLRVWSTTEKDTSAVSVALETRPLWDKDLTQVA